MRTKLFFIILCNALLSYGQKPTVFPEMKGITKSKKTGYYLFRNEDCIHKSCKIFHNYKYTYNINVYDNILINGKEYRKFRYGKVINIMTLWMDTCVMQIIKFMHCPVIIMIV